MLPEITLKIWFQQTPKRGSLRIVQIPIPPNDFGDVDHLSNYHTRALAEAITELSRGIPTTGISGAKVLTFLFAETVLRTNKKINQIYCVSNLGGLDQ